MRPKSVKEEWPFDRKETELLNTLIFRHADRRQVSPPVLVMALAVLAGGCTGSMVPASMQSTVGRLAFRAFFQAMRDLREAWQAQGIEPGTPATGCGVDVTATYQGKPH
jgi:hypothetical protein